MKLPLLTYEEIQDLSAIGQCDTLFARAVEAAVSAKWEEENARLREALQAKPELTIERMTAALQYIAFYGKGDARRIAEEALK